MDVQTAASGLSTYLEQQKMTFSKSYQGPLFSFANLAGLANSTTGLLASGRQIVLFAVPVGGSGQGFATVTLAGTNHTGGNGEMPGGKAFVAEDFGVYIDPQSPEHIVQALCRGSYVQQFKNSFVQDMGNISVWPCGVIGPISPAVSTTEANTTVSYTRNGGVSSLQFADGGSMNFASKQPIKFVITTTEDIYITNNGLPANDGGTLITTPILFGVVMNGWFFELSQV